MVLDFSKSTVDLAGASGQAVQKLLVTLGWNTSAQGKKGLAGRLATMQGTDLDISAVVIDRNGRPTRYAGFDNRDPYSNGSLEVSPDNRRGKGQGGVKEWAAADLPALVARGNVGALIFWVTAFSPDAFQKANNVEVGIVDQTTGRSEESLGIIEPDISNRSLQAIAVCKVVLTDGTPRFSVINEMHAANSPQLLLRTSQQYAGLGS